MKQKAKLILITGCMFSGKTTKVIALAQKALSEGKNIEIFYPEMDTRYTKNYITSHDMIQLPSTPLSIDTAHIQHRVLDVVFIDEIHFFKETMIDVIHALLNEGVDVIVSGLDKDFRGDPFPITQALMEMIRINNNVVIPDLIRDPKKFKIILLEAKCVLCQKPATFSQRIIGDHFASKDDKTIVVGGSDMYEPRCPEHFIKPQ